MAYAANNYGAMLSTFIYTMTYLVFIDAIFNKVKTIAGYSYGEILLLLLLAQMAFYLTYTFSSASINVLAENVKNGNLDLWLTRPVPILWFVSVQKINLNGLIMDGIPAIIVVSMVLSKNIDFSVTTTNLVAGILVMIVGLIICHCFQFMMNTSCFWVGENRNMRNLIFEMVTFGDSIPFEGYSANFQKFGFLFLPPMITSALATSVLLGKSDWQVYLPIVSTIMVVFLWLNMKVWEIALKHYSSASS